MLFRAAPPAVDEERWEGDFEKVIGSDYKLPNENEILALLFQMLNTCCQLFGPDSAGLPAALKTETIQLAGEQ